MEKRNRGEIMGNNTIRNVVVKTILSIIFVLSVGFIFCG